MRSPISVLAYGLMVTSAVMRGFGVMNGLSLGLIALAVALLSYAYWRDTHNGGTPESM